MLQVSGSRATFILAETGEISLRCNDEEVIVRAGEGALFLKGKKYYRYVIKPCRLHLFGFESNDILFSQMHIVFGNTKRVLLGIKYPLKVLLSHARQLLLNSDLLIKEIAQLCGFENEYYFSNFFKRNMKLSPKNYRKMYMNF